MSEAAVAEPGKVRRRRPWLAGIANLLYAGLGYLYVGRGRFAIAVLAGSFLVLAVAGWTGLVFNPIATWALALGAIGAQVAFAVHAWRIAAREREAALKRYQRWWAYLLWIAAGMLASSLVTPHRAEWFGYEPFHMPASSMAPALESGDYVMTDTWHFRREAPAYGDVAVFEVPNRPGAVFVKRIIGLPGDTLELHDDVLVRNGETVDEPYVLLLDSALPGFSNFSAVVVPDDTVFVLGDNRRNSLDSRMFGPVPIEGLRGRVVHRWFAYDDGIRWERFPERLRTG